MWVRESVQDDLMDEVGLMKQEFHFLWPWVTGLKCLNNDEAPLPCLVWGSVIWIIKKLGSVGLAVLLECIHCGEEEIATHVFFHCIEGFMVHMLCGKIFVFEASSVAVWHCCWQRLMFCLLRIMRAVMWMMWQKAFHVDKKFPSFQPIFFFKLMLKVKIRKERKWLSSSEFEERGVKVSHLCWENGDDLEWHLDAS